MSYSIEIQLKGEATFCIQLYKLPPCPDGPAASLPLPDISDGGGPLGGPR